VTQSGECGDYSPHRDENVPLTRYRYCSSESLRDGQNHSFASVLVSTSRLARDPFALKLRRANPGNVSS